jgi:hypothetical protein
MVLAVLSLISLRPIGPATALSVGKDFYVPGPAIKLARYLSSEKFSRDGQFFTYIDEGPEDEYVREKQAAQRGEAGSSRALVRFDLKKGSKQVLYTPKSGETLMAITPVGRGGDVFCTLTVGTAEDNRVQWRAIFCPVGGTTRTVVDQVVTRSFQVVGSPTDRKAFILVCGEGTPARYLFVTPERTVEKSLEIEGFQAFFFAS